jgi:hypothetical protein
MMAEGLTARRAVLALLDGVLDKGVSLAEQGDAPLAGLSAGDRARAAFGECGAAAGGTD